MPSIAREINFKFFPSNIRDESILDAIDMALRKEFGSDRKTND